MFYMKLYQVSVIMHRHLHFKNNFDLLYHLYMLGEYNFSLIPVKKKNQNILLLCPQEKHLPLNNFSITFLPLLILNIFFVSALLIVDLQELIRDIHLIFNYSPKVHANLTILQVNGFCFFGVPSTPL